MERSIYPTTSKHKGTRYQVLIARQAIDGGKRVVVHKTFNTLEEARKFRDDYNAQYPPQRRVDPNVVLARREDDIEFKTLMRTPKVPFSQQEGKLILRDGRWILNDPR